MLILEELNQSQRITSPDKSQIWRQDSLRTWSSKTMRLKRMSISSQLEYRELVSMRIRRQWQPGCLNLTSKLACLMKSLNGWILTGSLSLTHQGSTHSTASLSQTSHQLINTIISTSPMSASSENLTATITNTTFFGRRCFAPFMWLHLNVQTPTACDNGMGFGEDRKEQLRKPQWSISSST